MNKTVYDYDPTTGEYKGTTTAPESPLEPNVYMIPAHATETEPPQTGEHEAACWINGAWEIKADWRGTTWYDKATQEKHEIKNLDEEPDSNWTDVEPTNKDAIWNGTAWVVPFSVKKSRKYAEIASARWAYETAGMPFNGNVIKTDRESVALLKGAYDEAIKDNEYTVNWKGENGFIKLTSEQIIVLYQKVKAHVQSAFDAEMMIDTQIASAQTEEELDKIHWIDPN